MATSYPPRSEQTDRDRAWMARPLRRLKRWMAVALVGGMIAALAPEASAAPPNGPRAGKQAPPAGPGRGRPGPGANGRGDARVGRASVSVMVVHANHSGRFDPRLEDIRKQLQGHGFTGAKVLSTDSGQLGPQQSITVNVEGGRKVKVTLISRGDTQSKIRIVMTRNNEKKLDTTVSLRNGRTFTVGGTKFQDGRLMFPITVR